jgi:heme exporter protein A
MTRSATPINDPSSPLLEVRALHLWRGERHLLKGVSLALRPGELLQVVGANGAGKTTLLRAVCGLLPFEDGEILWRGVAVRECRAEYQAGLAYLAHSSALKLDLTALENLHFGLALRRVTSREQQLEALEQLGVLRCADLPVRSLSAGQRRRVALARVLLYGAALWILDEAITNLDAAGTAVFEACMASHLERGGAVLTAAHQLLLASSPRSRTLDLH